MHRQPKKNERDPKENTMPKKSSSPPPPPTTIASATTPSSSKKIIKNAGPKKNKDKIILTKNDQEKKMTPTSQDVMSKLWDTLVLFSPFIVPIYLVYFGLEKTSTLSNNNKVLVPFIRTYLMKVTFISLLGYIGVRFMIPITKLRCEANNLYGKDLGKKGNPQYEGVKIPESQGLPVGIIFLMVLSICQLVFVPTAGDHVLLKYDSSLSSICFMLLLGFIDDVLDLPWRYKLVLPPIASLPLLCSYRGATSFVIPSPLRWILFDTATKNLTLLGSLINIIVDVDELSQGKIVELGIYFMIYMALLAVFCTNAINIYAGINGLEVGQSYIISLGIMVFQLLEIIREKLPQQLVDSNTLCCDNFKDSDYHLLNLGKNSFFNAAISSKPISSFLLFFSDLLPSNLLSNSLKENYGPSESSTTAIFGVLPSATLLLSETNMADQLFILTLIIPFTFTSLALLQYNWYPASVFVGDTFCYFAGMTFAVCGIHGHFSKTLFFLFIPQIVNFILSLPQLFKLIPCPRHRLPKYNPSIDKVGCSICDCKPEEYQWAKLLFGIPKEEKYFINFTLINVVLRCFGPLHEKTLTSILLLLQILSCAFALYIRFVIAPIYFLDVENL